MIVHCTMHLVHYRSALSMCYYGLIPCYRVSVCLCYIWYMRHCTERHCAPHTSAFSMHHQLQSLIRCSCFCAVEHAPGNHLVLLSQANCSEQQVRQYLANLRSNLRSFIQRAQRNAAGKAASATAGTAGPPAVLNQRSTAGHDLLTFAVYFLCAVACASSHPKNQELCPPAAADTQHATCCIGAC